MKTTCSSVRVLLSIVVALLATLAPGFAQTLFLDFDTPGQLANFNIFGTSNWAENNASGIGGSGAINVTANNDSTLTYKISPWNFSTVGANMQLSVLIKANAQTSGNKIQLGIINVINNGLNANAGTTWDSYRFIPNSSLSWSLRRQYKALSAGTATAETTFGNVTVIAGHWYLFSVNVTNFGGSSVRSSASFIDYGTDGQTVGAELATFNTQNTATITDLAASTAVYPAFRNFQNAGMDAFDNFRVGPLVSVPTNSPPAPTNLVAVSFDSQVSLSWAPAATASGYIVKRSATSGSGYTVIGTSAGTNYTDPGLVNNVDYFYVVSGTNVVGEGTDSNEAVGHPNPVVTGITAVGGTNQVALTWTALPGAVSYTVLRAASSGGPFSPLVTGLASPNYLDTAVVSGQTYFYRVSALLTGGGLSGQSATISGTTAPSAATLNAVLFATNVIRVGWTANNPVVTQYFLERSTDGVNFAPLITLAGTATSYTNTGLTLSSTYSYRVRAANATGPSDYSNIAGTNTPAFGWNINFGAGAANSANAGRISPIPPGYLNDIGDIFGDRTNGCFYGWTNVGGTNIVTDTRWRQNGISPDLRYDTFIHLMKANVTTPALSATWEIQVPNGPYVVHIVSGDSDNADANADHFQFSVEGVLTSTYIPAGAPTTAHWGDHIVNVAVNDGRLTVTSGSAALNNKIAFIDIYPDIPVPPVIGAGPQSLTSEEYRTVSLSVNLSQGSQPLTFQWYFNDSPLGGATNQTLTFSHVRESNEGSYFLVLSNYGGAATSSVATLTVTPDVTIPYIVSVGSIDGKTVGVCFNEELDNSQGVVTEAGNYSINNNSVAVLGVTIRPDNRSVVLQLQDPITGAFTLGVFSQSDLAGNYLDFMETNSTVLGFDGGDVGSPGLAGSNYTCDNQNLEIVGGGADIWDTGDRGYLATKSIAGDFDARVRVNALVGANAITKAVLVARESTSSNSAALHISVNPPAPGRNQIEMGLRPTNGTPTVAVGSSFTPAGVPNAWMRITRLGNVFTGYRSSDGVNWVQLGQTNLVFASSLEVGIGVTAHDNTLLATGTFSGLVINQSFPDLAVSMAGSPQAVAPGSNVTYTITVTNSGSAPASGTVLTDVLPIGLSFVSAISSQGTAGNVGNSVTANLGAIASGSFATVTIVATATNAGTVTNTASVATSDLDTNPSNNSAAVATTITAQGTPPILVGTMASGGMFLSSFGSQGGFTYEVQYSHTVAPSVPCIDFAPCPDPPVLEPWYTLTNIAGDGTLKSFSDSTTVTNRRFYRIIVH